jgi:hypothetical protein
MISARRLSYHGVPLSAAFQPEQCPALITQKYVATFLIIADQSYVE